MRVNASFFQYFWQRYYNIPIIGISLFTSILLWHNNYQIFDTESLQILWLAKYNPQNIFQYLLHFFTQRDSYAAIFLSVLTTLSLWLFCRISLLIGIGRKTTFLLFLLINFNPEFNDVRFQISAFQLVIPLWLLGMYIFFLYYHRSIYIAYALWSITTWFMVLFVPATILWAIFSPLIIVLWQRKNNFRQIGRYFLSLLLYYAVLTPVAFTAVSQQKQMILSESAFPNIFSSINLDFSDKFFLSAALVAISAVKVVGLIILLFAAIALIRKIYSVLEWQVKYFFIYCLFLIWLIITILFLCYGYLPGDLVYTPVIMLVLWLSSGAVSSLLQRLTSGKIAEEKLLVLLWLMIAYALVSIIFFGPAPDYLRDAGLWAKSHFSGNIYSNHYSVLYYAGKSPLSDTDNSAYMTIEYPRKMNANDVFLYVQNRKKSLPDKIKSYEILKIFRNRRGDKVYILRHQ